MLVRKKLVVLPSILAMLCNTVGILCNTVRKGSNTDIITVIKSIVQDIHNIQHQMKNVKDDVRNGINDRKVMESKLLAVSNNITQSRQHITNVDSHIRRNDGKIKEIKASLGTLEDDLRLLQCPRDTGYCVKKDGTDQNHGQVPLSPGTEFECLKRCRAYPGATGCEMSIGGTPRGCTVHTQQVARGSGSKDDIYYCWPFSECQDNVLEKNGTNTVAEGSNGDIISLIKAIKQDIHDIQQQLQEVRGDIQDGINDRKKMKEKLQHVVEVEGSVKENNREIEEIKRKLETFQDLDRMINIYYPPNTTQHKAQRYYPEYEAAFVGFGLCNGGYKPLGNKLTVKECIKDCYEVHGLEVRWNGIIFNFHDDKCYCIRDDEMHVRDNDYLHYKIR